MMKLLAPHSVILREHKARCSQTVSSIGGFGAPHSYALAQSGTARVRMPGSRGHSCVIIRVSLYFSRGTPDARRFRSFTDFETHAAQSRWRAMSSTGYVTLKSNETRLLCLEPGELGQPLVGSLEVIELSSKGGDEASGDSAAELQAEGNSHLEEEDGTGHESDEATSRTSTLARVDFDQGDQMYYTENRDSEYEAISYAWGERVLTHEVSLPPYGSLNITENLYSALKRFRLRDESRRLWVDAISINQEDTDERSTQVGMMAAIFGSASRILVWLGESEPADTLAFATIATLFHPEYDADIGIESSLEHIDAQLGASPYCACCNEQVELPEQPAIVGIIAAAQLTRRAWFSRLWVVQEAALGRVVIMHSGSHSTTWRAVRDVLELPGVMLENPSIRIPSALLTMAPPGMLDTTIESIQLIQTYRSSRRKDFNTSYVLRGLMELSSRRCFDPRDRIFAVRSILGLSDVDGLQPDYSLLAFELYRRLTIYSLAHETRNVKTVPNAALMLALVGTESSSAEKNAPSWVPDLANLTMRSRAKHQAYGAFRWQFKDHPTGILCEASSDQACLIVTGRIFASVGAILEKSGCPRLYPEEDHAGRKAPVGTVLALIEWYQRCRDFSERYLDQAFQHGEYTRDLLDCGDPWDYSNSPEYGSFKQHLSALYEDDRREMLQGVDPYEIFLSVHSFLGSESHSRYDRNRNLCALKEELGGRMAWVPQSTREGDHVCILHGAPFPFVIRRCEDDHGFKLLGDAWVYPLNEEEAMQGGSGKLHSIAMV